ncbi:MAG TPA: hypothetical protein VHV99_16870, partial [Paraburkholderia sp.]|nr:hypothetical protein [Paraburkholderia sp.]
MLRVLAPFLLHVRPVRSGSAVRLVRRVFFLRRGGRAFHSASLLARRFRRVAFSIRRITAPRVAGLHLIGGRRRILVRRS